MNVKQDLTTAQQMSLLQQSVSTLWEGFDAPVLTTWALDWTSPPMLLVKVSLPVARAIIPKSHSNPCDYLC